MAAATTTLPASDAQKISVAEMSKLLIPQLPDGVDPTKMQLAYGRRAIPKMVKEFFTVAQHDRQKSLVFLSNLLRNPENISQALGHGIIPLLSACLREKDLCIRQKSTECLATISGYSVGRSAIVADNTLMALSKLFDDTCDIVRLNVHRTFSLVTTQLEGVLRTLLFSLLVPIVKKIEVERQDVQILILETVYNCTRLGKDPWIPKELMDCGALGIFTKLLKQEPITEVKVGAAKCIMVLTFYKEAKELATKSETLPFLIGMLYDRKSEVRAATAGAIMSISVDCDAKRIVVRENAITPLIELLDDRNPSVVLNVIKVITNVAEDYRGRFQLHSCVKKLESFFNSNNLQVSQAAKIAVSVITWRP